MDYYSTSYNLKPPSNASLLYSPALLICIIPPALLDSPPPDAVTPLSLLYSIPPSFPSAPLRMWVFICPSICLLPFSLTSGNEEERQQGGR